MALALLVLSAILNMMDVLLFPVVPSCIVLLTSTWFCARRDAVNHGTMTNSVPVLSSRAALFLVTGLKAIANFKWASWIRLLNYFFA